MIQRRSSTWRAVGGAVAVVALVLLVWNVMFRPLAPRIDPEIAIDPHGSAAPSVRIAAPVTPVSPVSPRATSRSATPSARTTASSSAPRCTQSIGAFVPTKVVIERLNVAWPTLALPLAQDGTFPVPPLKSGSVDPRWSVAWWRDGAVPGSGKGVVHLDVHTYTAGVAAGNLLGRHARVGDVVKLLDGRGRVGACYKVTAIPTLTVAQVRASLSDVSRRTGPAGLAVEFCWETPDKWGDHQWRLRRYLIGEPIE